MKSWLAGFVSFGLMYTVFIVGIFVLDWPTVRHPHLYSTLEAQLPESLLKPVLKVLVKSDQVSNIVDESTYQTQSFRLKDGSVTDAIVITNGNVIVLRKDASSDVAKDVALRYVALLEQHVESTAEEFTYRLIFLLVLPLTLLALFAVSSRWLWNKLLLLR